VASVGRGNMGDIFDIKEGRLDIIGPPLMVMTRFF
jgi:hypothetical protein